MTTVEDAGCSYLVVFPDGTGTNPVAHLVNNPSCPGIADDYRAYLRISRDPLSWHLTSPITRSLAISRARGSRLPQKEHKRVDPDGYAR